MRRRASPPVDVRLISPPASSSCCCCSAMAALTAAAGNIRLFMMLSAVPDATRALLLANLLDREALLFEVEFVRDVDVDAACAEPNPTGILPAASGRPLSDACGGILKPSAGTPG